MAATEVNARWQAEMAPFFAGIDGRSRTELRPADRGVPPRPDREVIHMADLAAVKRALAAQRIETPSWAFGNSGTRFKVFAQAGVPRNPRGEDRRRRDRAPVHRRRADGRAAHPVGQGGRLRGAAPRTRPTLGRRARRDQHQRLPGRRLQARLGHQPGPGRPPQGHRSPARGDRHHGRDRVARPEAVVLRRHQLPGPGRPAQPPGPAGRGAARDVRPARRRPADPAGVQALRAGLLRHRRPGLGHVVRALHRAGRQGDGAASTPATTRPARTSSSSWRSCCGRGSSAPSTSTAASTPTTT